MRADRRRYAPCPCRLLAALDERIAAGHLYGDFQFSIDATSDDFLHRGILPTYAPADAPPDAAAQHALSPDDWRRLLHLAHVDEGESWACTILDLHVDHTPHGIARAAGAFRALIDVVIPLGGSYFLTYHRWATRAQVLACHPRLPEFLRAEHRHDPDGMFQSSWYRHHAALVDDAA